MANLSRTLKEGFKSGWFSFFRLGQKMGFNLLPQHFYSAIPDMNDLDRRTDWRVALPMVGVNGIDAEKQISFVESTMANITVPATVHEDAARVNGEGSGFGFVEAQFLFAFIAQHKPKKIVQVGCGVSTAIILAAAKQAGYTPEITCIEPYPTDYLLGLAKADSITLRHEPAQTSPLSVFEALGPNDLFFVDSTHTVKVGSEVNRIILDVLPRIATGVWVHFHDISFPYDYPPDVFTSLFLNSESTLLHAFLINNARYEIAAALSMLHLSQRERLKAAIPVYDPQTHQDGLNAPGGTHYPSSAWLRTI